MNSIRKIPYVPFASKKGHNFIKFGSECVKSLASALKTLRTSSLTSPLNRPIDAVSWPFRAVFENAVIFNQEIVRR